MQVKIVIKVSFRYLHYIFRPPHWWTINLACTNLVTNIWSLREWRDLKLGEVPSWLIFYSTAISGVYPLNSFPFPLHDNETICRIALDTAVNSTFFHQLLRTKISYRAATGWKRVWRKKRNLHVLATIFPWDAKRYFFFLQTVHELRHHNKFCRDLL